MIGGHRVWREGDLVGMHFHGPLTRADFTAMRTLFAAVMAELHSEASRATGTPTEQ